MVSKHYLEEEFARLLEQPGAVELLDGAVLDGLWLWDLDNPEHEWVSPGLWRALGYDSLSQPNTEWYKLLFPEDRDALFENAQRHCEDAKQPFDQTVRFRGAGAVTRLVRCRGMAIRTESGEAHKLLGAFTVIQDAQRHRIDRQLSELVELSGDAVFAWSLEQGVQRWNRGAVKLFGVSEQAAIGQDPVALTRAEVEGGWDHVFRHLRQGRQWSGEVKRHCRDGSVRYTSARLSPIEMVGGDLLILEIARDSTDERRQNEKLRLLNRELNHRVKNLFAVVQGLVSISGRGEEDPAALTEKIQARIAALAAAHLISIDDEETQAISFRKVLDAVLAPYDQRQNQLSIGGSEAMLPRRAVTPVGMIFHELATNTVKYGAWSEPGGHLAVTWIVSDPEGVGHMHIKWTEKFASPRHGAAKAKPGLGLPLIQQSARQLDGELTRTWTAQGLETVLSFSLAPSVGQPAARKLHHAARATGAATPHDLN
ncbi:sensor histidine kinase [Parvularcula maris]|uniref:histidine kinase n=1 Tax=Parvularcula maris TaxID=2965077 RepID=A0A9X2LAC3_9PROT|nr:HWE histidine kinase domain-containing protein [Parvularcula maris]MCQ8186004.1 PAS domain-containing protein [Parvularcula maris]